MIPDFPILKHRLKEDAASLIRDSVRQNSLMVEEMTKIVLHEGDKWSLVREDGTIETSKLNRIHTEITFSKDEISGLTDDEINVKIHTMAELISKQINTNILKKIEEAVSQTGNIVESPNGLTHEWILETLNRMPILFDNDDINTPNIPTIHLSPEMFEKFKFYSEKLSDDANKSFKQSYDSLINIKYQEYMLDLEKRKLLDA